MLREIRNKYVMKEILERFIKHELTSSIQDHEYFN